MNENRLHLTRIAVSFLLILQGLACVAWWAIMFSCESARAWFSWPGMVGGVLESFFLPDIVLYAMGSILAGHALSTQRKWSLMAVGLATGAVWYAELHALSLSLETGGGWAGSVLMAPSALFMLYASLTTYRLEKIHAFGH